MAVTELFLCMSVACFFLHGAWAFVPNKGIGLVGAAFGTSHSKMTRSAALEVTADLLRDNPNPDPTVDSTGGIDALSTLTPRNLITAYYGAAGERVRAYQRAVGDIRSGNSRVDISKAERKLALAHFDSEQFQAGQNRLIDLKEMSIKAIQSNRFTSARKLAGRALHTLQDFYSHSNWVEMGMNNPYSVLGKQGQKPENVAPLAMPTCSDCERTLSTCNNNILANINQRRILTSGYYSGQVDDRGQRIAKASGKCSHGGVLDSSRNQPATGGINKDSTSSFWSPHHYNHDKAVDIATKASVDFLQNIRSQVNDDAKYATFLGLKLQAAMSPTDEPVASPSIISISYVIDTTGSMSEELPEIQRALPQIRIQLDRYIQSLGENVQVRFILVPFNDPDPGTVFETLNISDFLNAIGRLIPDGGGDCPEPSIGALIRAIRVSESNSPIFVFTDAPPSDPYREAEAQALISEKGVTVNYGLTAGCSKKRKRSLQQYDQDYGHDQLQIEKRQSRSDSESIYEFLAAFSGGQVLNLQPTDIGNLSSLISFSAARTFTTILHKSSPLTGTYMFNFPVDETATAILISVNGRHIQATVRNPQGIASNFLDPNLYSVSLQSTTSYIATINVSDSRFYGEWQLDLVVFSGPYTVRIAAVTDLTFEYTLYSTDSSSDYNFTTIEGNPQQGQPLLLFIETRGDIEGTNFNQVSLLNNNGDVIEILNLTSADDGDYIALDVFMPPETFQLQIHGFDSNRNPISRISSSGVETVDIDLRLGEGQPEFYTLFPGNTTNVILEFYNFGANRTFTIEVTEDDDDTPSFNGTVIPFTFSVSPERVIVAQNETTEILITVTAPDNATDGVGTVLIATVSTDEGESTSDFIAIEVTVSTIPPPEDTENDYYDAGTHERVGVWCILAVLACVLILTPF